MTKTGVDIGNCDPDFNSIQKMLTGKYNVVVQRCHQLTDAIQFLSEHRVDLILINRKLDVDYTDGVEILRHLKLSPLYKSIPTMIVTNYAEHQEAAVADGAEYGFGKLQYGEPATHERLSRFLDQKAS
jgi:CheY-like chemotaxis protein